MAKQGQRINQIYQIIHGECAIYKNVVCPTSGQVAEKLICTLSKDETFGELHLLCGDPSRWNIKASTDTELKALPASFLEFLFKSDPSIGGRFFKFICCICEQRLHYFLVNHMPK